MDIQFSLVPSTDEIVMRATVGVRSALETQTPRGAASLVADAAEEFRTKYAEFVDWLRADADKRGVLTREARTASLPSATLTPSCKGCGAHVEEAGQLCASCEHKGHLRAPEGMVQLKDQGTPKYKTEGNFRDLPAEFTEERDIPRVSES